ncbi:MAG: hypothetical protein WA720_15705 [Pseudolabrys sp.]
MTKLLSLAAVIGVSFFCVAAAQSMPLAPLEQAASLTIPVAGLWPWLSPRPVWRLPSLALERFPNSQLAESGRRAHYPRMSAIGTKRTLAEVNAR